MQHNVEKQAVLKAAGKAGYTNYVQAKEKKEEAFQTAFIKCINDNGGGQIRACATGEDEPRTGADVIISWSARGGTQEFRVYLQIKVLFESKAKYLTVADFGSGNEYTAIGKPWEYPYFNAQYRSKAVDYDGEYQVVRLYETIKDINKVAGDRLVAAAGFLLVGGPSSEISIIPLSTFLAELAASQPGVELVKQLEMMKDTMLKRLIEDPLSCEDILRLPHDEDIF